MPTKSPLKTLITLGLMMSTLHSQLLFSHNLSHEQLEASFEAAKQALVEKVQRRGDLPYVSMEKQLELIEQASQCQFGKFLIERSGLNGYWAHYVITHPMKGRLTKLNQQNNPLNFFEDFLLNRAPTCLATQQRFAIFKTQIQKHLHEGCSLASIPCGLMADLLDLDFSHLSDFTLYGIDLDPEALSQAAIYAEEKNLNSHCQFFQRDAWDLRTPPSFDVIASNGLNIYEPDDDKVVDLYRQFYNSLKATGVLVTSFLTPPPIPGQKTEWILEKVNSQDALLQKIIFVDILSAKWQVFRTEEKVKAQLKEAGFSEIEIFYDDAHIFPTVVAKK